MMSLGSFDQPFAWKWEMVHGDEGWAWARGLSFATFATPHGAIIVRFHATVWRNENDGNREMTVAGLSFRRTYPVTLPPGPDPMLGWHVASRVFSTIVRVIREYVERSGVDSISFGAANNARLRIYIKLLQRFAKKTDLVVFQREPHEARSLLVLFNWKRAPPVGTTPVRLPPRSRRRRA